MTQSQLRDLVRASNPVVHEDRLLPEERDVLALYAEAMQRAGNPQMSTDLLDVERRRDMQTQEKQAEFAPEPRVKAPRRRLVPAFAAAIVVIVAAAGVWAMTRTSEPDIADRSPLDVTDLFNETVAAADWSAASELYAADATYQWFFPGGQSPEIRFADGVPGGGTGLDDWNGDGMVTQLDWFYFLGAEIYAGGTTTFLSCSQPDAATAVCDEAREGYAFTNDAYSAQWTFTITDGLISSIVIEIASPSEVSDSPDGGVDTAAVAAYEQWVMENRPELVDELFLLSGQRELTPENVDTHRELVVEWLAAR